MTRREWLISAAQALAGVDSPRLSAELLLARVLRVNRLNLLTDPQLELSADKEAELHTLLERRCAGEPLAYLLKEKEFYGRSFTVGPATLIPRPESEHLIDEALERLPRQTARFMDLGTGTGCLAVTLLAERPSWSGIAVDISARALELARQNAQAYQVDARLEYCCADFTQPAFEDSVSGGFFLVISNPPYISEQEYHSLDITVRVFEPKSALVPGESGLEHLRHIVRIAALALCSGGILLMEHGASQGQAARNLCNPAHWNYVGTGLDLAGHERFLVAEHR